MRTYTTSDGTSIAIADVGCSVWRLGFEPSPWAWAPWKYADENHRFDCRWDDPEGQWRALYVAETRLGCFLECLAHFRAEPTLAGELDEIDDDPEHPTTPTGTVPLEWRSPRLIGKARMDGVFAAVTAAQTLSELRRRFLGRARQLGLHDVDAGSLRLPSPRRFTQEIAGWLYGLDHRNDGPLTGIQYRSRHGDEHLMWAVYEREPDVLSPALDPYRAKSRPIDWEDPDLLHAMELFGLTWSTSAVHAR